MYSLFFHPFPPYREYWPFFYISRKISISFFRQRDLFRRERKPTLPTLGERKNFQCFEDDFQRKRSDDVIFPIDDVISRSDSDFYCFIALLLSALPLCTIFTNNWRILLFINSREIQYDVIVDQCLHSASLLGRHLCRFWRHIRFLWNLWKGVLDNW